MSKIHCHRSDRMAQQMYCGKSVFNNLNITFKWNDTTCISCRRSIRKKQIEYREQNPTYKLPPLITEQPE